MLSEQGIQTKLESYSIISNDSIITYLYDYSNRLFIAHHSHGVGIPTEYSVLAMRVSGDMATMSIGK